MFLYVKFLDDTGTEKSEKIELATKLTFVQFFREKVSKKIKIPGNRIRIFYSGKEVVDTYQNQDGSSKNATLFDYDVRDSNTLQLILSPELKEKVAEAASVSGASSPDEKSVTNDVKDHLNSTTTTDTLELAKSEYFVVSELVDAKNLEVQGAWMEAIILGISRVIGQSATSGASLVYTVQFEDNVRAHVSLQSIRPRAWKKVPFDEAFIGKKMMVNYNLEDPHKVGYYFDFLVTDARKTRCKKSLIGTIFLGPDETPMPDCQIRFIEEMYEIENTSPILARDESQIKLMTFGPSLKRMKKPDCDACLDDPSVSCKDCSCFECGGKDEPEKQLLCEECTRYFHLWCLDPPIEAIPDDDWFCKNCKNIDDIVKPGQRMKSAKKDKMPSAKQGAARDWGRGMACAGLSKECSIVPKNHFGPVPGIEVGMSWQYRVLAAEAGAHRPPVAGIHGRVSEGAYSIVLSGGYEDDTDEGDRFTYTGSGGRNLQGNKRTAEQSMDQLLTNMNQALARNCAAKLNKNGAEASDWKKGKPVRVLRGHKGHKQSKYCPKIGFRYDGVYKVAKYWPEKGRSGFIVWRYLLVRDDPIPAPWTEKGQKRIEYMGFQMEMINDGNKRKNELSNENSTKKFKVSPYELSIKLESLIEKDVENKKNWKQCKNFLEKGELKFKTKLMETFHCVICQEMVVLPVTLECGHNFCKKCLISAFKSEHYQCASCRMKLDSNFKLIVNEALHKILTILFKGYAVNRGLTFNTSFQNT